MTIVFCAGTACAQMSPTDGDDQPVTFPTTEACQRAGELLAAGVNEDLAKEGFSIKEIRCGGLSTNAF